MKINILGSDWKIVRRTKAEDDLFNNNYCAGYCDWTAKLICAEHKFEGNLVNPEVLIRKVIRHEIVHAFLFESGLAENSKDSDCWARNEEMVDWIAVNGPKIYEAWSKANAL